MPGADDALTASRRALLDALEPHRDALVLIGAQAVYLWTAGAPVALAGAGGRAVRCFV